MTIKQTKYTNPTGRLDMSMQEGEPIMFEDDHRNLDVNIGELLHQINLVGPHNDIEVFIYDSIELRGDGGRVRWVYERGDR